MIELNQAWAIVIAFFALVGAVAIALYVFYSVVEANKQESPLYVSVKDFKEYLIHEEEKENYSECERINNLIGDKADNEKVLLPEGYEMLEVGFLDKELKMNTKNIIFKFSQSWK